jgi:hypothetical protein
METRKSESTFINLDSQDRPITELFWLLTPEASLIANDLYPMELKPQVHNRLPHPFSPVSTNSRQAFVSSRG